MQVLKFGGSSVANAENIQKVIDIVTQAALRDKTILVCSAISGATDELIEIGQLAQGGNKSYEKRIDALFERHIQIVNKLLPKQYNQDIIDEISNTFKHLEGVCRGVMLVKELTSYTNDLIMSFGELLSTRIIYACFLSLGLSCKWVDSREVIKTEYKQSRNVVDTTKTYKSINNIINSHSTKLYIFPGFIASDSQGRTTTLGRGGSDYTASLLAVGAEARLLEIWTDVNGMMTADPRIVPQARTIEHISYKEALELSHFGAKVVYPPTIQPVVAKGIPILVKNTFSPHSEGTLIEKNPPESSNKIKGISGSDRIALLSMEGSGMVGIPGYSSRLFQALAQSEIDIILITQASSVHTMLVAIDDKDAKRAKEAADEMFAYEISLGKVEPLRVEAGFSIISLIGDDMKNQSGASGRMFEAIGQEGVNIRAIAQGSSEKNVSAVVSTSDVNRAVKAVHNEFFSAVNRKVNLFIAGYGNVGKTLCDMIKQQREWIVKERGVDLNIVAVSNSRSIVYDPHNLFMDIESSSFVERVIELNIPKSLFIDCTSSPFISSRYAEILSAKIGVVTCNKIANSSSFAYYKKMREFARREGVSFLYETNVGAALPIISLLKQMNQSGDKVISVEACLSGTLNYLFSNYDTSVLFENVVENAKAAGYTEPDPMIDLKGVDVLRKTVILAREIGLEIEENDVEQLSFLPNNWPCEEHFIKLYRNAAKEGRRLRYITQINNGKASISLKSIDSLHPFYNLTGTGNAVLVYSDFYPDGVMVTGAGAGARQTAQGLLNDILQI